MKSEMTEKEARAAVARARCLEVISDLTWQAIKEGLGLEFAPEPARLPAAFMLKGRTGSMILVDAGVNCEMSIDQAEEVCRRAMLYPALYKTATEAMAAIRDYLGVPTFTSGESHPLFLFIRAVENELAKGPKP